MKTDQPLSAEQHLDLYFIQTRHKLLDVAALMDRVERAGGTDDFRFAALKDAVRELTQSGTGRTEALLELFSDPTTEPIPEAHTKGASGAWPDREAAS